MADLPSRLEYLISGFAADRLSAAELDELLALIPGPEAGNAVLHSVEQALHNHTGPLLLASEVKQTLLKQIINRRGLPDQIPGISSRTTHRVHFLKTSWLRSVAAAIFILIIGTVAYLWKSHTAPPAMATTSPVPVQNDVAAPNSANATITLASGQQIILDSASNGTLAKEGNVKLVKLADGKITYSGISAEIQFNTLTNPRGSRVVNLTLADGSQVWLNAESSIHYPTSFIGKERKVEITGEAYFEVTKDPKKKFIVSNNGMSTEVLGTHFNINAYDDEAVKQVTLLEGSIRVHQSGKEVLVKPGDQAVVREGRINVNTSIDVEKVMAWKNGLFSFQNSDLRTVMNQLERWYDIKVRFEGPASHFSFDGKMYRNVNISDVLEVLQRMGVKFKMEGKTLIVL